ncbi:helix-turn-helix domain-containing protein [Mycobacterium avium]
MTEERLTSLTVGKNLKRLRAAAGMTTRVLAASLAENGVPMSPSGISEIENGRRGVNVDQLTALAAALDVSPLALLTPIPDDADPDAEVMLSGTSPERAVDIHLWLKGERPLNAHLLDDFEQEAFRRRSNPVWTYKKGRG